MSLFSASERAALDRVTVPAMRAGLAGDIVAAARSGLVPARRTTRGGWRRHGRVLLGATALVIASATAAATGLLDRLPIRIPGITRVAEAPAPKPKPVVRAEKPRAAPGKPVALAAIQPLADPTPIPPTPQEQWRERRAERIAAGLPVRRPLIQRAMAAKLRAMPPAERRAAIAQWRRIKALPPEERKLAMARVRADYLARHPRMAQRYEQRLEARSARAATGADPIRPAATSPDAAQPIAGPRLDGPRLGRGMLAPGAMPRPRLAPAERAQRQQAMREWRIERRARRMQGQPGPLRPPRTPR